MSCNHLVVWGNGRARPGELGPDPAGAHGRLAIAGKNAQPRGKRLDVPEIAVRSGGLDGNGWKNGWPHETLIG